jgi:hypothetical protein
LDQVELETNDPDEPRPYAKGHRCPACGYRERHFPEPMAPLTAANDPLAAVLGQALIEALPPARPPASYRPMDGRNTNPTKS